MKHIIILLFSLLVFTSCRPEVTSLLNYPSAVVVDKGTGWTAYHVDIRYKDSTNTYIVKYLKVSKYEYDKYSVGDTIK